MKPLGSVHVSANRLNLINGFLAAMYSRRILDAVVRQRAWFRGPGTILPSLLDKLRSWRPRKLSLNKVGQNSSLSCPFAVTQTQFFGILEWDVSHNWLAFSLRYLGNLSMPKTRPRSLAHSSRWRIIPPWFPVFFASPSAQTHTSAESSISWSTKYS